MPYINPTVRKIYIDEEDFELIFESLEATAKKCRTDAVKCNYGFMSVSSQMKAEKLIEKSDKIRELLSRICTEII